MIQRQTKLKAMDNSGARYVKCIKTFGGFNRIFSYSGDIILITIKTLRLMRKVRIGQIHLGIITRTRKISQYKDGTWSKFGTNSIVLLTPHKRVMGTRLFGWISRRLRKYKFLRILIMCGWRLI